MSITHDAPWPDVTADQPNPHEARSEAETARVLEILDAIEIETEVAR